MAEESAINKAETTGTGAVTPAPANEQVDIGLRTPDNALDLGAIQLVIEKFIQQSIEWAQSPQFYAQVGIIVVAITTSWFISRIIRRSMRPPAQLVQPGTMNKWRKAIFRLKSVLFPLISVLLLGIAASISESLVQQSWLVLIARSFMVVGLIYTFISGSTDKLVVRKFAKWVILPIAILYALGLLDDITTYLESIKLDVGNIEISLYAVVRVLIFGTILFWLGRVSNDTGKQFIRNQQNLEVGTREVFAKLFEIGLVIVVFILLLQVMGINITALAVFGGALGVGLGFGLQSIASNFISGLIILLDRSLTVGDYIELEDGQSGTIRAMNMRSTVLETFDGKDIVVPNETFVTSRFINWTHKDIRQRYSIEFQVAYSTDLNKLIEILRTVVASHPQVISGADIPTEIQPDAEISGFGDSGVDILIEFWMEGIDDGKNRVGADLYMMIWEALRENGIEIPFPQREVRIIGQPS